MIDEQKLLMGAYAGMTPWARGIILELALGYAADFPNPQAESPRISIEPPPHDADESVDRLPLIGVGQPVDS